jgi:serine/threonine protein kinase
MSEPSLPQRIHEYKILGEISRGGMGIVFRGQDENLDRPVAMKMLPPKFFSNAKHRERFNLEAKIVANLDHANILRIYAYENVGETVWIIMELLTGELLSDRILKGKIPPKETAEILEQLGRALHYAHSKGIVHRDIKPENVMIDPKKNVKLMDFGIARDQERSEDLHLTQAGTILGTPKYMSPEQFTGDRIDARTDIYSLGIMAYEMLTGALPFQGKTLHEVAYKHMHEHPPQIRKKIPNISKELEKFVQQSMEKKKENRPQTLENLHLIPSALEIMTSQATRKYKLFLGILLFATLTGSVFFYLHRQKIEKKNQQHFQTLLREAQSFLDQKEILRAKALLLSAKNLAPNDPRLEPLMSEANRLMTALENKSKAKNIFGEALQALIEGQEEVFSKKLREAIALDPDQQSFFEQKGENERTIYRRSLTKKYYDKAIQCIGESDFKTSNDLLKKCLEMDPHNVSALNLIAENYWELNDLQSYAENTEKSLEFQPKQEKLWSNLSKAYSELGDMQKAKDTCARGLANFPASQELLNLKSSYGK